MENVQELIVLGKKVEAQQVCGFVKWFDNVKGYGFMTPDPGQSIDPECDVLVPRDLLRWGGFETTLRSGDYIHVLADQTKFGKWRAVKVTDLVLPTFGKAVLS